MVVHDFDRCLKGSKAALMTQRNANVFTCEIGNLDPGETCIIQIEYVTELGLEDSYVRFHVPTLIVPGYARWPQEGKIVLLLL